MILTEETTQKLDLGLKPAGTTFISGRKTTKAYQPGRQASL